MDHRTELNGITGRILDASIRIHSKLGSGLREKVYEVILARDLERMGDRVERQKIVPLEFEGLRFPHAFRPDLIVNGSVIVEVKSLPRLARAHHQQLHTYLRLLDLRVGLLINFGAPRLKDGFHRIVNRF